jgi:hypothetical protein
VTCRDNGRVKSKRAVWHNGRRQAHWMQRCMLAVRVLAAAGAGEIPVRRPAGVFA